MSDYQKAVQAYLRAKRRQEREELRVAREIQRARRSQEKAEERQSAQLEVEEYDSRLNMLLSLHREVGERWDWHAMLSSLPPCPPTATNRHEMRVRRNLGLEAGRSQDNGEDLLEAAQRDDRLESEAAQKVYEDEHAEWTRMRALARRILSGDLEAYRGVMTEYSPLGEMEQLGSQFDFTVHSRSMVECVVTMKRAVAIPTESKSLTSTGKLSTKAMPRQRFHEIYQDYICGGVLRVAREIMAILPVDDVLVTVMVPLTDPSGAASDKPVLSVVIERSALERMNFGQLDPSDTIETLIHRGDFKATRKTEAFLPIVPIRIEDVALPAAEIGAFEGPLRRVAILRNQISEDLGKLQESAST